MIEHKITGSPEEVEIAIAKYFNCYHPAGYGTYITSDKTENGVRTVYISRYRSCD